MDLSAGKKTILCGVVGALNQDIECFVQIGLPNVVRMVGRLTAESELHLVGEEPPVSFRFSRAPGGIAVAVLFEDQIKGTYVLQAA